MLRPRVVLRRLLDRARPVAFTGLMRQFAKLPIATLLIAVFSSSAPAQDKAPEEARTSAVNTSKANVVRVSESRRLSADRDTALGRQGLRELPRSVTDQQQAQTTVVPPGLYLRSVEVLRDDQILNSVAREIRHSDAEDWGRLGQAGQRMEGEVTLPVIEEDS